MKVLRSTKAFCEKYSKNSFKDIIVAGGSGGVVTTVVIWTMSSVAANTAAAMTPWAFATGWPLVGGLAASKVAAVSAAAASAAVGTAILPAIAVGGVVTCALWARRKKRGIGKMSPAEVLADAFARIAWLPTFAQASELCARSPQSREAILRYVQKTMGDWGYSEAYVQYRFDEALSESRDALDTRYDVYMGKLNAGKIDELGVSPQELPPAAVRRFADEFRSGFQSCIIAAAA